MSLLSIICYFLELWYSVLGLENWPVLGDIVLRIVNAICPG